MCIYIERGGKRTRADLVTCRFRRTARNHLLLDRAVPPNAGRRRHGARLPRNCRSGCRCVG